MYPSQPQSIEFEPTCSQGHRSSRSLETLEGGSICLLCLSNLISDPKSPTFHVSYALSRAIAQPNFHPHFLVSPLVDALSCFDNEAIACQLIDLVSAICDFDGDSLCGEFVARIARRLSSGELVWSRRQVYTVLDLLSTAEQVFIQRFAIGFSTLVPALRYVAEIPFHPVQAHALKFIWNCVSNCPGLASTSHVEELGLILTGMLKKYTDREAYMLTETFSMACSILVAIMSSASSHGTSNFSTSVQDASRHAILACLSNHGKYPSQLMYSLYLLKEAYAYHHKGNSTSLDNMELRNCILNVCKTNLLPWFVTTIGEMEEEIVLGVLETFHSMLIQDSDIQATEFANILVSSSCFSFAFGCLGLFPTEKMKWRVYLLFSSIVDVFFGNDIGQPIRDAALHLPSDPVDLLFLLGQKSSNDLELSSC